MNACTDVYDGENATSHQNSIAVVTPKSTTYMKADGKDEISRWYDVLVMYPRSRKTKNRRSPTYPVSKPETSATTTAETQPPPSDMPPQSPPPATPNNTTTSNNKDLSKNGDVSSSQLKRPRLNGSQHSASGRGKGDEKTENKENSRMAANMSSTRGKSDVGKAYTSLRKEERGDKTGGGSGGTGDSLEAGGGSRNGKGLTEDAESRTEANKYRGVRNLKHKHNKQYSESLRKSNSLSDLVGDSEGEEAPGRGAKDSGSRHRPVSASSPSPYSRYLLDPEGAEQESDKPKTLFESLLTPEPPRSKNDRYLKLANIPVTRPIEQYVGHVAEQSRSRSCDPPRRGCSAGKDSGRVFTNRVANTAKFWESKSESNSDSPHNSPRLHDKAVVSSSSMPSPPAAYSRRSRRDLFSTATTTSKSSPSTSPCPHPTTTVPMLDAKPRTVRHLACIGIRQDTGAARSRSSSPPLRNGSRSHGSAVQSQQQDVVVDGRMHRTRSPTTSLLLNGKNKNETDERKMAKSGIRREVTQTGGDKTDSAVRSRKKEQSDDLMYMKKGWLVKQGSIDRDWTKHWFVLSGASLKYYHDSVAEAAGSTDGVIDLSTCYNLSEINVSRNYGFKILTHGDIYILSAMTSGIRDNWMQAISKCMMSIGSHGNGHLTMGSPSIPSHLARRPEKPDLGTSAAYPWRVHSTSEHPLPLDSTSSRSTSDPREQRARRKTIDSVNTRERPSSARSREPRYKSVLDMDSRMLPRQGQEGSSLASGSTGRKEEQEVDDVEHDARRIHRKSITEFIHHQRPPQHLQTFESGSAPRESGKNSVSEQRVFRDKQFRNNFERELAELEALASHSTTSASPPTRPRWRGQSEHHKQHQHLAPSAKVKERSKAKATRPRSPPPDIGSDELDRADASELIEHKWKQVEKSGLTKRLEAMAGEDGPLVELLETEVESLKAQLDQKNLELEELQHANVDLKSQLRLNRNDHRDSLNDMETDQGRFLSQISDIQDQMQHTTDYLQAKLAEETNKSAAGKQQVAKLNSDLRNAEHSLRLQEDELKSLRAKLGLTAADLSDSETALGKAEQNLKKEHEATVRKSKDYERKLSKMADELNQKVGDLREHERANMESGAKMRQLQTELEDKKDRIENLEAELQETSSLKQELVEKSQEVDHLQQELNLLRQQLRSQDEGIQKIQREGTAKIKSMEDEFYREKEHLDNQLQEMKKKYERAVKQHSMADSLTSNMTGILTEKDEIISQLEEKVIELDAKIVELSEELNTEVEDNGKLRVSLEETCQENGNIRQQLEEVQREAGSLQEELEQISAEDEVTYRRKMENELLTKDLERMEDEMKEMAEDHKKKEAALQETAKRLMLEVQDLQQKLNGKSQEITKLKLSAPKMTSSELSIKYDALKCQLHKNDGEVSKLSQELKEEKEKAKEADELRKATKQLRLENEELKKLIVEAKIQAADVQAQKAQVQKVEMQKVEAQKTESIPTDSLDNKAKQQHHTLTRKLADLQQELRNVQQQCKSLEAENGQLKQDLRKVEVDWQEQLSQANTKVADLQNKLTASERRVQRLERRRSDKAEEEDGDLNSSVSSAGSAAATSEMESELIGRVKALEIKLEASEVKLSEVTKRLLDQKSLEVEISILKAENRRLRESEALCDRSTEEEDHFDPRGHLQEVEFKLGHTEALLEQCRFKISDIVTELKMRNISQSSDAYIQKLPVHLQDILATAAQEDEEGPVSAITKDHKMHLYAEKLALEAAILNKMATCMKEGVPAGLLPNRKQYILQISHLDKKIQSLEHSLSGDKSDVDGAPEGLSVAEYASLLTDKMVLQSKIATLIGSIDNVKCEPNLAPSTSAYDKLAECVLRRCVMDQNLLDGGSGKLDASSVAHKALLQAEVAYLFTRLRDQPEDLGHSTMYSNLQSHLQTAMEAVDAHVNQQIQEICNIVAQQNSVELKEESLEGQQARQLLRKDMLHKEIDMLVEQYLTLYSAGMSGVTSKAVQERCRQVANEITTQWNIIHNSQKDTSQDFQQLEESRLNRLTDLVHLLVTRYLLCAEVEALRPKWQEAHEPLGRRDSGHSSQPTSPISKPRTGSVSFEVAESLQKDSVVKSQIATHLLNNTLGEDAEGVEGQVAKLAFQLMDVDFCLLLPSGGTSYVATVSHEAMHQAQLAYTAYWARADLRQEMAELQRAVSSRANSHVHEEHISQLQEEIEKLNCVISEKEMELQRGSADANISVAELQSQLDQKEANFQQELQRMADDYDLKHKQLQSDLDLANANISSTQAELEHKHSYFEREVQALKDGYEIRIRSLQSDLEVAKEEVDKANCEKDEEVSSLDRQISSLEAEVKSLKSELELLNRERDEEASDYEQQILELEDKVSILKGHHKRAIQDMEERVSSAEAAATPVGDGDEEKAHLVDDIRRLQRELQQEKTKHQSELEKLREGLSGDVDGTAHALLSDKIQQLQLQIQNMQADYEQEIACQKAGHRRELARSKDDLLQLLASVEAKSIQIDEGVIRKRYTKELDRIREMSERGYAAMEKSHQRVIMEMRRAQKKELDLLRQEKDQLLDEETKATQAALDAMRKAHEAEIQKERNKFLDMMAKTYSQGDVESLQRQHEDDLELIQLEMRELTEQYSIKCLENASLEERLDVQTKALHGSRKRVQDLLARNEELSTKLKHEIEKLNRMITLKGGSTGGFIEDETDPPEVTELKELEDSMDQYHELFNDSKVMRQRYEAELSALKRRIEEQTVISEEEENGALLCRLSEEGGASAVMSTTRGLESNNQSSSSDQGTRPVRASALRVTTPEGNGGSQGHRHGKKVSWRLRQPQRSLSSPGLTVTNRVALPRQQSVEQTSTHVNPPAIGDAATKPRV